MRWQAQQSHPPKTSFLFGRPIGMDQWATFKLQSLYFLFSQDNYFARALHFLSTLRCMFFCDGR